MADAIGDGWMKELKATTGYEMALAVEGSVNGCEVVLEGAASAAAKRYCLLRTGFFGDTGKGISLLTLVLLAGLVVKSFYPIEIPSFAQNDSGVEAHNEFTQELSAENFVPGYREYESAFAAVYPKQEIRVDVEDCTGYEKTGQTVKPVIYTDHQGVSGDGIYMEENCQTDFCVDVEEEGFYELSLEYAPVTESDSAVECSILIDGEVPYRELERVCYDRIWTRDTQSSEAGCYLTEQAEWITGVTYDRERRIAEPLSVYLTKGEHRVSLISIEEPTLLHQIIFSQKRQIQEYRDVKGFWDAVGIRAVRGRTVVIEAEQVDRTSARMEYPEREEVGMAAMPLRALAHAKEAKRSMIGGESWDKAGSWFEWEFEVEESGYYQISLCFCQNYAREGACRKIMLDGAVLFQEMERYGFAYGWGWKEDVLADDTGDPYVFYIKEGRHTLRIEAVPGETEVEKAGIGQVQPLAIDWIRIVPAGNV